MEDAASRKARLKRLRDEAQAAEQDDAAAASAAEQPKLKFRNYDPRDEKIEHDTPARPVVQKFETPNVEPEVFNPDSNEELLINVAPKKPNWDLRRAFDKKLQKLERRTQRAMIQIMQNQERERLEQAGGAAD